MGAQSQESEMEGYSISDTAVTATAPAVAGSTGGGGETVGRIMTLKKKAFDKALALYNSPEWEEAKTTGDRVLCIAAVIYAAIIEAMTEEGKVCAREIGHIAELWRGNIDELPDEMTDANLAAFIDR